MRETSPMVVRRYVSDALTAERELEAQLEAYAEVSGEGPAEQMFRRLAAAGKGHQQALERYLKRVEESPAKGLLDELFSFGTRHAIRGKTDHRSSVTEDVVVAFGMENCAIARYEVLCTMAEAAGDGAAEDLARTLQKEKQLAAENLWQLLPLTAWREEENERAKPAISGGD